LPAGFLFAPVAWGSWTFGSTLQLNITLKRTPKYIDAAIIILRGVFMMTQAELDWSSMVGSAGT